MEKLYFASTNETKIREAQKIIEFPIQPIKLDITEIQDFNIENVVKQKATDAYQKLQQPVFVDDAGVYIEAWNGFPGPFLKYLMQSGGNKLVLKMLGTETNRKAEFVSAIGFHDGSQVHTFLGKVSGIITTEVQVPNNPKVDAIFIPEGQQKTYAEMTLEEKNAISHRKKSLEQLKKLLQSNDQ